MKPARHDQPVSPWLTESGPHGDVVISSRVRLARNLAGYPFLTQASAAQRQDVLQTCRGQILHCDFRTSMRWLDLNDTAALDRQLLVERHIISRQHSQGGNPRGVAISNDESVAIMVNEEDHVRLQVLRGGMQLQQAYDRADEIDDTLESELEYAYTSQLGYLTACPTNVGTGIRVSVMLHVPALKLTGEIEKLRRAAKDMHLAVRGFYGEGTEALGDLFQVSNQTTLGQSEQQILCDFQDLVIPQMIEFERAARRALVERRPNVIDDRIWRAWGTLCNARLLSSEEALQMLSSVRLGAVLERFPPGLVEAATINELMLLTQPAHLQRAAGRPLDGAERREVRAQFVRLRLTGGGA